MSSAQENADPKPKRELIPKSPLSWFLIALAATVSVGGIFWAAASGDPAGWGGRGGALGVAISFGILFARETSIEKPFSDLMDLRKLAQDIVPNRAVAEPEDAIDAIVTLLTQRSAAQTRINLALAGVGILATLAWGFGDLAAVKLYPSFHGGKPFTQNPCCSPQG